MSRIGDYYRYNGKTNNEKFYVRGGTTTSKQVWAAARILWTCVVMASEKQVLWKMCGSALMPTNSVREGEQCFIYLSEQNASFACVTTWPFPNRMSDNWVVSLVVLEQLYVWLITCQGQIFFCITYVTKCTFGVQWTVWRTLFKWKQGFGCEEVSQCSMHTQPVFEKQIHMKKKIIFVNRLQNAHILCWDIFSW